MYIKLDVGKHIIYCARPKQTDLYVISKRKTEFRKRNPFSVSFRLAIQSADNIYIDVGLFTKFKSLGTSILMIEIKLISNIN